MDSSEGSCVSIANGSAASAARDCLSRTSRSTSGVVTHLSTRARLSSPCWVMRALASSTATRVLAAQVSAAGSALTGSALATAAQFMLCYMLNSRKS
jgi:hypothetical protein